MGAGASSKYGESTDDDKKAAAADLNAEQKAEILDFFTKGEGASAENKANVKKNKANLHELESVVMGNKQKIYAQRAYIEENRALILKNYAAAFMGNRQMTNQNTEDIFRNRKAIMKCMKPADAVQLNFLESHLNCARIDFLEHRASMNGKVAAVNEKMCAINTLLMDVNADIMQGNTDIVDFNSKHLDVNTKLLSGEIGCDGVDAAANKERIDKNTSRMAAITTQAQANASKCDEVLAKAKANRDKILENQKDIYERRALIEANHDKIAGNAGKISDLIRG